MRGALVALVTGGVLLLGAAPAAPPDHPVAFISVDVLHAALARGTKAHHNDLPTPEAYEELHIAGARSIPLRTVQARARDIARTGLVVLY